MYILLIHLVHNCVIIDVDVFYHFVVFYMRILCLSALTVEVPAWISTKSMHVEILTS